MVPLRRNRDFVLLQAGRFLSAAGSQSTSIAYPLLVLAITHSPAKAGVVSFAGFLPYGVFPLLAGVAADRWNRKRIMVATDGVRLVAVAGLGATIVAHRLAFWQIPLVAFVEGTGAIFFRVAYTGALHAVVPTRQLADAAGVQGARGAAVRVAGPPLGGALFGIGRAIPFLVDAVSYAFSTLSLLAIRTEFQEERERGGSSLRAEIAEAFRFLWKHRFLRACAFFFALGDFSGPGLLLALVVIAKRQGLSSGAVGLLVAAFGACLFIGSAASPLFRRMFSMRAILLIEAWTWVGCALFLVWPSAYVLLAGLIAQGIAIPVTNSVLTGYSVAITPDRLLGRVEGVRTNLALLFAPVGPLLAGFLLGSVSQRSTIAVFAAVGLVLALWATVSPSIRNAPTLDDLDDVAATSAGLP